MNTKLSQLPFVRLIIPLIAGISFALYFPAKPFLFYSLSLFTFCSIFIWNKYNEQDFGKRSVFGMLTGLFLLLAGYSTTLLKSPASNTSYFGHYIDKESDSLFVEVLSSPQGKEKTIKLTGEINSVILNGKQQATSGKALFYFEKDSGASNIKLGDVLFLHADMQQVKPPSNPDEFDYCNYLAMHGIQYEAYIRTHSYSFTGKNNANRLLRFTNRCREKLISLLNDKIKGSEATIGSAILLGYRDDLSPGIIQQFADSGTIHVICVAGLHVGILFWLLGWLLLPLERLKRGKLVRTIILVLMLWFYAMLTGLSTPVIRATVMFSFLAIGRHLGKYTNSINTLAASAFLILLLNPFSLADTGFQLSYLAVLGILLIYPLLNKLFDPRNLILEKIWEITCLSVSAQVVVVPLSILYFHQFPNYFILTNLLIVPLLSVVIYAGVIFFITSSIPFISVVTAWLLQKSLLLMNTLVNIGKHLPYFVSKGLSISIPESLLLYIVLALFFAFVINKKYKTLFTALSCFIVFLGVRVYKDYVHSKQQIFIVYNTPKHSAVAFLSGKQCKTTEPIDSVDFSYHIQYHWWEKGIKKSSAIPTDTAAVMLANHLYIYKNQAQFNDLKIIFIRNNLDLPDSSQKIKVQYLVLSGNYWLDIAALQNAFIFDKLIFDSSVSASRVKKWKDECEQLHISYYDVSTQGAFIENI